MSIESYGNNLRMCGDCSAQILTMDLASTTVYCTRCTDKKPAFGSWADSVGVGSRVFVQPYIAPGRSHGEFRVVARNGKTLTVEQPGTPSFDVGIWDCAARDVTPWSTRGAMY